MQNKSETEAITLEEVRPLTTSTSVVAEDKAVTCPWQGGTIKEGETRCKDHVEYKCGSNGQVFKTGNKCD